MVRPADANETALAWRFALAQTEHPTAFALSRQGLPVIDPDGVPDDAIERGAYVLRDAADGGARGDPDRHRLGGRPVRSRRADLLEADGIATRVVSACPAWSASPSRTRPTGDAVLPPGVPARVAVEAASPLGWDRWMGDGRRRYRHDRRSATPAPAKDVYEHFGFTPENVAERARRAKRVERLRGARDERRRRESTSGWPP